MGYKCPSCEDEFDGKSAVSSHHNMAHGEPYYDAKIRQETGEPTKEWLNKKYHGEGKSLSEIGEILDCGGSAVGRMMKRHDLETRKSNKEKPPWFGVDSMGYESFRHNLSDGMVEIRHHRLLAIAEYGVEAVSKNDVHHKNENTWDNRLENLELMEHGEHRSHHASKE